MRQTRADIRRPAPYGDDPVSFHSGTVADLLEKIGRPRMAEYVREMGDGQAAKNRQLEEMRIRLTKALQELDELRGVQPAPEPMRYKSEWE